MPAIGRLADGEGLTLVDGDGAVPIPERLGHEHRGLSTRQWIVALIGLASGMATAVLLH